MISDFRVFLGFAFGLFSGGTELLRAREAAKLRWIRLVREDDLIAPSYAENIWCPAAFFKVLNFTLSGCRNVIWRV